MQQQFSYWQRLVIAAIQELGGGTELVKGARLRQKIDVLAHKENQDFGGFLADSKLRFADFLEKLPGIVLEKQPGSDMFVGAEGARRPAASDSQLETRLQALFLRNDVYEALTRITPNRYYYVSDRDEFTTNSETGVPLPQVTWESLIEERRRFAELQANTEDEEALLRSLSDPSHPLQAFQACAANRRLGYKWHEFKIRNLKDRLQAWASQNGIGVLPSWFIQPARAERTTPQQILATMARYLTDEEVRSFQIPFRALEALYRDLSREPDS